MKRILLIVALLTFGFKGFAQKIDTNRVIVKTFNTGLRNHNKSRSIIVLNDRVIKDNQILDLINPNDIEDISVLNGKDSKEKFGNVGEFGALIVKTKKKLKLINLENLFKKFDVEPKFKLFDVYIKGQKILYKDEFLIYPKWVKEIWLRKDTVGNKTNFYLQLTK